MNSKLAARLESVTFEIGIPTNGADGAHGQLPKTTEARDQRVAHTKLQRFVAIGSNKRFERKHRQRSCRRRRKCWLWPRIPNIKEKASGDDYCSHSGYGADSRILKIFRHLRGPCMFRLMRGRDVRRKFLFFGRLYFAVYRIVGKLWALLRVSGPYR